MVTVILTIWKRNYLEEQIEALLSQTIPPEEIWVYQCHDYVSVKKVLKKYPQVRYQGNTNNLSYFGRFSLGLHVKTPFVYILDDDVLPTSNWIANCIKLCEESNSIIASSGRVIPLDDYTPEMVKGRKHYYSTFIGDADNLFSKNYCAQNTNVDYGCNSWFFKTAWLYLFWSVKPFTYNNGEDIHLSASCKMKGGINTIVPFQDGHTTSGNLKKFYGWDKDASHIKHDFFFVRENIFRYLIDDCGWRPISWDRKVFQIQI